MESVSPPRKNADEFARFYGRLSERSMAPLWEVIRNVITSEPVTPVKPAHWRFSDVRPLLFEAGKLISAEEAERRVLVLENPGLPNQASVTHSLYAGIQLVLPGEVAPQHRHSQGALRFVLEGKGATTTVNGERFEMYPGDLVLTPSLQWHDHQNETDEPIIWMDGLDIALVALLDAQFAQSSNQKEQEVTQAKGTSSARYGANLVPIDETRPPLSSPLMRYPYDQSREALEHLKGTSKWDAHHGIKMRYAHPQTGDWALPTMGPAIQLVPKGFKTAPYRATDSTVYAVAEGSGTATVGYQDVSAVAEGRVRRAVLGVAEDRGQGRSGAVQLLRPARAREARSLARGPRRTELTHGQLEGPREADRHCRGRHRRAGDGACAGQARLSLARAGAGARVQGSRRRHPARTEFLARVACARRRARGEAARGVAACAGDDGRGDGRACRLRPARRFRAALRRALCAHPSRRSSRCAAEDGQSLAADRARDIAAGEGVPR